MFFGTFGLYQHFWWYMHWARYRRFHHEPMWPVARAILPIFFAHSLNREIHRRLGRDGIAFRWEPAMLAVLFVLASVVGAICDRLSVHAVGSPWTDLAGLVPLLPIPYSTWRAQQAADRAGGGRTIALPGRIISG